MQIIDEFLAGFGDVDLKALGIPTLEEYIAMYSEKMGVRAQENWEFYVAFVCFRFASILQGVYKRSTQGTVFAFGAILFKNPNVTIRE